LCPEEPSPSPGTKNATEPGEKLTYIHNHWDGLQTFLTNGRVEIDSNRVENLIRPIALNRKNALFAGHDEGGVAWGRIASLIGTCKINGGNRPIGAACLRLGFRGKTRA